MVSVKLPISKGITAPPEIAIIINPEISFALSGSFSTAMEKTNGKILATPSPMAKMITHAPNALELIINKIIAAMDKTDVQTRNLREETCIGREHNILAPHQ